MRGVSTKDGRRFFVTTILDKSLATRLKQYMEREDRTAAWVARRALMEFLDRQEERG